MKVLLLAKYNEAGPSSRYRTLQYLGYLADKGIQVTVNSLLESSYIAKIFSKKKVSKFYFLKRYFIRVFFLIFKNKAYDLCWVEGELFPYMPFFIEKYFLPNKYIVEYDDAIFHNYNMHRFKFIRWLLGKKIDEIMRRAQHVVVGNEYVRNYAATIGASKVTIVPTVVDALIYKPSTLAQEINKAVVIGWLGSPTTVKYLKLIETALLAVAKKTDIKLYIIGGEYTINGIETLCHHWPKKWVESEEIALLNQIDIGIMPLSNLAWDQGKCGFKLIKYMACGKPVIASPVSCNQEIVVHNVNGYLAETLSEWEDCLLKLIAESTRRNQFGSEGRKIMVSKYSLQATSPILYQIFHEALK